jgi:hypothetical protein
LLSDPRLEFFQQIWGGALAQPDKPSMLPSDAKGDRRAANAGDAIRSFLVWHRLHFRVAQ